ncbi:hypothetical protein RSOLAG1IB_09871 [Rhizoctonia solani AG-1 IB]|uniref:Uncharacterized protein n=1 Tax=Thanatephorus cucumeris (strain AG1-IB / isolate 7/3/14) TaxID=1108050 RepID=A0A0B7FYC3_THACB|nr:hypothetical protein RSOLAG1IB_09871 [Rhizoctonia solani AG-1 IB]
MTGILDELNTTMVLVDAPQSNNEPDKHNPAAILAQLTLSDTLVAPSTIPSIVGKIRLQSQQQLLPFTSSCWPNLVFTAAPIFTAAPAATTAPAPTCAPTCALAPAPALAPTPTPQSMSVPVTKTGSQGRNNRSKDTPQVASMQKRKPKSKSKVEHGSEPES